ncbi:VOC family protein [Nocardia sp. FBN12]|uniref:VOC family protein n=1 Tax=Nocardia sp. FBN12 TaxID=3419766 RepID=UPI003D003871
MTAPAKTLIYPVTNLGQAKALYRRLLGIEPVMDEPYYVQFDLDGHLVGLDPNGHAKGLTGPAPFWLVADIHQHLAELIAAGAVEVQAVTDVGGGKLIASVTDADGNIIGLMER